MKLSQILSAALGSLLFLTAITQGAPVSTSMTTDDVTNDNVPTPSMKSQDVEDTTQIATMTDIVTSWEDLNTTSPWEYNSTDTMMIFEELSTQRLISNWQMQAEAQTVNFDPTDLRNEATRRLSYTKRAWDHNCERRVPELREREDETCEEISQKIVTGNMKTETPLNFPEITDPANLQSLPLKEKMGKMWYKSAEYHHLAYAVFQAERDLVCRKYAAIGIECPIGDICSSENISHDDKFFCDTDDNIAQLHMQNYVMLLEHTTQMRNLNMDIPKDDVDIGAPGRLNKTDTALYTLGSFYTMLKESEAHLQLYNNM